MKKAYYLLFATYFTTTFSTAVFANDGGAKIKEYKEFKDSAEFIEFIDVMPKALENVDLSDPKTVLITAANAVFACEVDVSAYLTYIAPTVHNPKGLREHTISGMQQDCKKAQEMFGKIDVTVLNVEYNDDKTEAQVQVRYQTNETTKDVTAKLIKTANGWRIRHKQ